LIAQGEKGHPQCDRRSPSQAGVDSLSVHTTLSSNDAKAIAPKGRFAVDGNRCAVVRFGVVRGLGARELPPPGFGTE
jgi:hypothetical protein